MLIVDVEAQVTTFILSICLGAVICFIYDIFKAMHLTFLKGFLEVLVTDLMFWLISGVLTYLFLIIRCNGIVRAYVLCGIVLGFCSLRLTISKFLVRFLCVVGNIIMSILHFISNKFKVILLSINKYLKKVKNAVKKVLQKSFKVMYNQLNYLINSKKKGRSEKDGNRK